MRTEPVASLHRTGLAMRKPLYRIVQWENEGAVSRRGTVLCTQGSADHDGTLTETLQHGPSARQSKRPATRSRNHPACELKTNMVVVQQLPAGHLFIRVSFGPRTNDDA